ncbi:MAG: hypothetical protein ACLR0U_13475 [Enterocloster clostridioformis]
MIGKWDVAVLPKVSGPGPGRRQGHHTNGLCYLHRSQGKRGWNTQGIS